MSRQPKTLSPRVVVIGGMNTDLIADLNGIDVLGDTKDTVNSLRATLGGGAANCAIALNRLNEALGHQASVTLIAERGLPVPAETFDDYGQYVASEMTNRALDLLLKDLEFVNLKDGTKVQNSLSLVTEFNCGRHIAKQMIPGAVELTQEVKDKITQTVANADYLFIDPRKPEAGLIAAQAAQAKGIPVIIDYGNKEWPTDPVQAQQIYDLLQSATVLIMPSDAVVQGMEANIQDPDQLFQRLKNEYAAETIIMSDGSQPVRVMHEGKEVEIAVTPVMGPTYMLAAGDTRNAAFLYALTSGKDMLDAIACATALASVKIQYPAFKWAKYDVLQHHLGSNALFQDLFAPAYTANSSLQHNGL